MSRKRSDGSSSVKLPPQRHRARAPGRGSPRGRRRAPAERPVRRASSSRSMGVALHPPERRRRRGSPHRSGPSPRRAGRRSSRVPAPRPARSAGEPRGTAMLRSCAVRDRRPTGDVVDEHPREVAHLLRTPAARWPRSPNAPASIVASYRTSAPRCSERLERRRNVRTKARRARDLRPATARRNGKTRRRSGRRLGQRRQLRRAPARTSRSRRGTRRTSRSGCRPHRSVRRSRTRSRCGRYRPLSFAPFVRPKLVPPWNM